MEHDGYLWMQIAMWGGKGHDLENPARNASYQSFALPHSQLAGQLGTSVAIESGQSVQAIPDFRFPISDFRSPDSMNCGR